MPRAKALGIAAVVVGLCAIGVIDGLQRAGAMVQGVEAFDRRNLAHIAAALHVAPDSPEYAQVERIVMAMSTKLAALPAVTLMHVVPGTILLMLAPLQFSTRLRRRRPSLHRWNGRAILVLGALFGVGGIVLGVVRPVGGMLEASASVVFGGLFLIAGAAGYAAIRRRNMVRHREWMLRMFAIAIAASVIRLMAAAGILLLGASALTSRGFGLMFWTGFLVTSLATELWILRTRARPGVESVHGLQPL